MRILKRVGKILVIILFSITGILLLTSLALRFPYIQNSLIQKVTKYVETNSKGTFKVGTIYLNFPSECQIKDVLIKNPKGQILVKAKEIKFDLAILPLLHNSFQIGTIKISSFYAGIIRMKIDSTFNFQFLIDAFSPSTKTKNKSPKTKSSFDLSIKNIKLENLHVLYEDQLEGVFADAQLKSLNLNVQSMKLDSLQFYFGNIKLSNTKFEVTISKQQKKSTNRNVLAPLISINHLDLENVKVNYKNIPDSTTYHGDYPVFVSNNFFSNLNTQTFSFADLTLNNSTTSVTLNSSIPEKVTATSEKPTHSSFRISGNKISLQNNNFELTKGTVSIQSRKSITANHLKFDSFNSELSNLYFSSDTSKININELSFLLNNTFTLKKLSAKIIENGNSASISKLDLRSDKSVITGEANFNYPSINSLTKNPGSIQLNIKLKNSKVNLDEIGFFNKSIIEQQKINLSHKEIVLNADITGKIDDLRIKTLIVNSGSANLIILDGRLVQLTNPTKLNYAFPKINLYSTKKDIDSFITLDSITKNLIFPNSIVLKASLIGSRAYVKSQLSIGTPNGSLAANTELHFGKDTVYQAIVFLNEFNISGFIPKAKAIGKTTLKATLHGNSFSKENLKANFDISLKQLTFNNYIYHKIEIQGDVKNQQVKSIISVEDSSVSLIVDGDLLFKKGEEHCQFDLDLKGINTKNLNFTKDDLRLAGKLHANVKGIQLNNLIADVELNKLVVTKEEKTYTYDSISLAVSNTYKNSEIHFRSPIIDLNYHGSISPLEIKDPLMQYINTCYETGISTPTIGNQSFLFDATIKNHPSISEVFIPGLITFVPGKIKGEFNSSSHSLKVDFGIKNINYNKQIISNLTFTINGTENKIESILSIDSILTSNIKLKQIALSTLIKDNQANCSLTIGAKEKRKLNVSATFESHSQGEHKISFASPIIIDESEWSIPSDNFLSYKNRITYNNLSISHGEEKIGISSNDNPEKHTILTFEKFDIEHIAKILNQDSSIAAGQLNGYLNINQSDSTTTVSSDISLTNLSILNSKIGDIKFTSSTQTKKDSELHLILSGNGNEVSINGLLKKDNNQMVYSIDGNIKSINAQILDGLSLGSLKESKGKVFGEFSIKGTSTNPNINGFISFNNFSTTPSILNSPIQIDNDRIDIHSSTINFNSFTIKDYKNKSANISGKINFAGLKPDSLNLQIITNKFEVFNTTIKDNDLYFGQLIIDGEVNIKGTPNFPVINANIKLDEGSTFTFIVPEAKLSTDKGEGVVEFRDTTSYNLIMDEKKKVSTSVIKGYTINSRIEIDPKATLKILIDPSTGDSLNVKGDATMSFSIDPSGKISLTGIYELKEGSYVVSLQGLIQKKFKIVSGSTIRWNGDPMDAEVSIDAIYTVRTAPIDLVSLQIAGLTEEEKNLYKQRLSFLVNLQLRGQLLKPDITFKIELDEKDKGALGGSIDNKLNLLNADESELNKQVFALLLLNRFVQENPLATGGEGVTSETLARTSVSKFLSSQLNQIANNYVAGVELNFDVQSFEDYSTGTKTGRTQVGVGLKKEFLSDRISVQVGGNVDVEGQNAKQNNISELAGDVIIEYKLTKDGRLRFSAFRKNLYADAIEGQIIETGVGLLYNRDFDRWRQFFSNPNQVKLNDHVEQ